MSKPKVGAAKSAKRKRSVTVHVRLPGKPRGKGKPFEKGNPWRFEPGQSGNPTGRPKTLGDAYKRVLDLPVPGDPEGRTFAQLGAEAIAYSMLSGFVPAAKEIRQAVEGDKVVTWQDEIIELIKAGRLTPEQVRKELGQDAEPILRAAGVAAEGGSAPAAGEEVGAGSVAEGLPEPRDK